jgi:hypothetical protein
VAAHEVRHLAQGTALGWEAAEDDATAYGAWAADVVCPGGKAVPAVHVVEGIPRSCETLRGVAEPGAIALAYDDDGTVSVWRNTSLPAHPIWDRHHTACPIQRDRAEAAA